MWYTLVWKKGTTVCPQERKERSRDASGSFCLQGHTLEPNLLSV